QVAVDPVLELVRERDLVTAIQLARARDVGAIDTPGATRAQGRECALEQRVDLLVKTGEVAHYADARALEARRVEESAVVRRRPLAQRRGGRIIRIVAREHGQQRRGICYGSRHRTRGVLTGRNGNDAGARDETDGRLDAHQAVDARRAGDRAVGLGTDGHERQVGRNGRARAGARPTGVAVEVVGILRLPAAPAPPGRGAFGSVVGPLAQVRLPEYEGA